jgi:peptidyl-prolyl cis-trans isomerase B (cyclophilin B)
MTLPAPDADPLPTRAVIDTSCGEITLDLATDTSPTVVRAFAYLADHGLYDGMTWDYAQPDAAVATGDPAGAHGSLPGFSYLVPEARTATFQAGGAGAQIDAQGRASSRFFISGSGGYTVPGGGAHPVLGTVDQGTDVVDALASFGDPADGTPDRSLYIFSIHVS